MLKTFFQVLGVAGTALCVVAFAVRPSYLTPDKIFVFLLFLFMAVRHAKALMIRLAPFVLILLVYEEFRGLASLINHRVEYEWMVRADEWLFGSLPTATLQEHWWHGDVRWLDYFFYLFYIGHFVLPIGVALVIWRLKESFYWRYISSIVIVSFAGFVTFLAFPAAPPWMADDRGLIEPIVRIPDDVWFALGIHDFPTLYDEITPNPTAAVPSLHAAYATIVALFVFRLFGPLWGLVSSVYPFAVYLGTVYLGEHYAVDEIIGAAYGVAAYAVAAWLFERGYAHGAADVVRVWAAPLGQRFRSRGARTPATREARPEALDRAAAEGSGTR